MDTTTNKFERHKRHLAKLHKIPLADLEAGLRLAKTPGAAQIRARIIDRGGKCTVKQAIRRWQASQPAVRQYKEECAAGDQRRQRVKDQDQRKPTVEQRLHKQYEIRAGEAAWKCLRRYARQSGTRIKRVASLQDCDVELTKVEGWVEYSRRFGNRRGITDAWYTITIKKGWLYLPEWVRTCDGLLTLGAVRCEAEEELGETIYRAVWAENAQGGVRRRSGYIVRHNTGVRVYTAHGASIGACRGSITRQLPESVLAQTERQRERAARNERIRAKIIAALERGNLNGYDVDVTISDSRRAGNCPAGTRHWVERHFPGQDRAKVSEVLAVRDQHERALMACVAAVRRQVRVTADESGGVCNEA